MGGKSWRVLWATLTSVSEGKKPVMPVCGLTNRSNAYRRQTNFLKRAERNRRIKRGDQVNRALCVEREKVFKFLPASKSHRGSSPGTKYFQMFRIYVGKCSWNRTMIFLTLEKSDRKVEKFFLVRRFYLWTGKRHGRHADGLMRGWYINNILQRNCEKWFEMVWKFF